INGKDYGLTPLSIDDILIGNHTVEISKDGYRTEVREVEIIEDEITECNVQLTKGYNVDSAASGSAKAPVVYNADGTRRSTRTRTVQGVVIDRNGYPVVGAKVMGTGGTESAEVAYDGTFSLKVPEWLKSITVEREGFAKKKMKIHDGEMLFKMKRSRWFFNPVFSYSVVVDVDYLSAGLMFGQLGDWGWYIKAMMPYEDSEVPTLAVGFTKEMSSSVYLYAGLGIDNVRYEFYDNHEYYHESLLGCMVDFGTIIKISNRLNIDVGCSASYGDEEYEVELHIGIGYIF
ncbi:MAG: PEGA domain-containing protein, partial [Bacteroidaceae bacterium]|nr:PEGA domain-containing protein [Bacteroidaceae bacterium]